jgi:F0F1-type ATP synthase epsilon subunit
MKLLVLTPEETLLETEKAAKVRLALADGGSIGIHAGHHPLLAETRVGPVEYGEEDYTEAVPVRAGILHVEADQVTIYTSGWAEESKDGPSDKSGIPEEALQDLGQGREGED